MACDQRPLDVEAELATLKRHLTDLVETMHGVVENGRWVTIPDPELRGLVGRYVADAVAALAAEVGADDAQAAAEELRGGGQLPISLGSGEVA
ncbi:hypothetical protein ACQP2Y_21210 [Actinoplanes sp. CA-051413]|uniref:hypothetical protein n=1 Tax=Actinoplanes sp. CA-051413 TaxID=3239899 RepID=UPI003D974864